MGSIGNPKIWVPFMNTKDCSKGVCSLYCRQWCPSIFPPPPPVEFSVEVSGPNFSPLVIAIIGILASAFLLVSYYAIISKYCGNVDSTRRRGNEDAGGVMEMEDNQTPLALEPWQNSTTGFDEAWQTSTTTAGLDEALIKSITVCKYRKGDGLIEGTECSVCLSEFQEDENLRLLPKCSHAFHVHCIDTWLRSHSNCPLCRANIIFFSASPLPLPSPVTTESLPPGNDQPSQDRPPVRNENDVAPLPMEVGRVQSDVGGLPKIPSRALSDLGNVQGREIIIEIRGEEEEDYQQMRRSVSMDHLCRNQLSVSNILHMNEEEHLSSGIAGAGPSKQSAEGSKMGNKVRVLHCVMNPAAIRRSFSSGRFFLTRQERE